MMTFLGLHVQQHDALYQPTLCSENRRRLFYQIFTSDKLVVSFTGRPPLVSRRFCSTPLPLDISDEDLASDASKLNRAVASLDPNGWNTHGAMYSVTVIRARAMIAHVRDELVEIALSHNISVSLEHLRYVGLFCHCRILRVILKYRCVERSKPVNTECFPNSRQA